MHCNISLSRVQNAQTTAGIDNNGMLTMNGHLTVINKETGENKGELFECKLKEIYKGGTLINKNDAIEIDGTDELFY